MHTRRSAVLPSLSLVLPHPPLPRRMTLRSSRSSIESYTAPHTPRTSGISSPSLFKSDMAAPRRSTDSWSSSIADGGEDDMEWEWTIDQVALLGKVSSRVVLYAFILHWPPSTRCRQVTARLSSMRSHLQLVHPVCNWHVSGSVRSLHKPPRVVLFMWNDHLLTCHDHVLVARSNYLITDARHITGSSIHALRWIYSPG